MPTRVYIDGGSSLNDDAARRYNLTVFYNQEELHLELPATGPILPQAEGTALARQALAAFAEALLVASKSPSGVVWRPGHPA